MSMTTCKDFMYGKHLSHTTVLGYDDVEDKLLTREIRYYLRTGTLVIYEDDFMDNNRTKKIYHKCGLSLRWFKRFTKKSFVLFTNSKRMNSSLYLG